MYRIKEDHVEGKTFYTLQEGYVRKFKTNGFGITKEVIWISRIGTTEVDLVREAYKAAQSMSSEDFKTYAKEQEKEHFLGLKMMKPVVTKIDIQFADKIKDLNEACSSQGLEAKMTEMITDLQVEAKKYKELKEVVKCLLTCIDEGREVTSTSVIVQAVRHGVSE